MRTRFMSLGCSMLVLSVGCAGMRGSPAKKWRNQPAPDFELAALDGTKVRLSENRGKPVVLAFFAHG